MQMLFIYYKSLLDFTSYLTPCDLKSTYREFKYKKARRERASVSLCGAEGFQKTAAAFGGELSTSCSRIICKYCLKYCYY